MKRVIEIGENMYASLVKVRKHDNLGAYYNAIADSISLNEVLDKIINKIISLPRLTLNDVTTQFVNVNDVINAIDKYKESEDKE